MADIPLHTRMITLRVGWATETELLAEGRLVDLRKRGIVPLAGSIQGPGIVHDMAVRAWLAAEELRIVRIEPSMTAYPFAPSPHTRGEGCPDRLPAVQSLVGLTLDRGYGLAVGRRIGGPRGCFHVFTLLRSLGPAVAWAVQRERLLAQSGEERRPVPGNPLFARSVIVDAVKPPETAIDLSATLSDVHYPPGAAGLPLEEELELGFEASLHVRVTIPDLVAETASGRSRYSGPGVEQVGPWEPIEAAGRLQGLALRKGYSARVQELLEDPDGTQPLTHLFVVLAPVLMQCMPSLMDELDLRPRRAEAPHAAADTCHMWRTGGPLLAAKRMPA